MLSGQLHFLYEQRHLQESGEPRRFAEDPVEPEEASVPLLLIDLFLHPLEIVCGVTGDLVARQTPELPGSPGAADDEDPLAVGVVLLDEVVKVRDQKLLCFLDDDHEHGPLLIPLAQLLADHLEHALRVFAVLRYLQLHRLERASLPVDREDLHVRVGRPSPASRSSRRHRPGTS